MISVKEELKKKIDDLPEDVARFLLDELDDLVEEYYALKVAEERKDDEVLSYEEAVKELKKSGHLPPEYPGKSG